MSADGFLKGAADLNQATFGSTVPAFRFDNTFARELSGAYELWKASVAPAPSMVWLNRELAVELGLDPVGLSDAEGIAILAGNSVPDGAEPLAQAYAGHQFGGFSPRLGDGRALLLGEVIDRNGLRRDIAFKGSGRTPFSRGGDGKAALGPVLREVLIGEAMQALGIPTTRVLAALTTGEEVFREQPLPGAILTRIAASHLRVGTLQYFAARKEHDLLRRVADYAIARHDSQLAGEPDRYLRLLSAVVERQAALIARWMGVGFIHGVMNTDNMTLSGETIDYGPCAFLEVYDPATVFSSIDLEGRYAYGNQPAIAQWNLTRLAEALLPLIDSDVDRAVALATEVLQGFVQRYEAHRLAVFRRKLGLSDRGAISQDQLLINDFLGLLEQHKVDFTLAFRALSKAALGDAAQLRKLFEPTLPALDSWLERWRQALPAGAGFDTEAMHKANPVYIARNYQVEAALAAAVAQNDFGPFERLLDVLRSPFDERVRDAAYALPASDEQATGYQTFCGT